MMLHKVLVVVVALMLTWAPTSWGAPSPPPPSNNIPSGKDKDAWPELLHMNTSDVVDALYASGLVQNVYVQHPSSGPAPTNVGLSTDVWVYDDGSYVYEIPRRGVWHPNRLIPGWPEVNGTNYKTALTKIKGDYLGVTVIYGPKSSIVRTGEIKLDRVYMEINSNSTVVGVPYIG